jgi:hypothetical protein
MINLPSTFCRNGRLMQPGMMPPSLTRAGDWARAETFAKQTSFHYRISAEPEQPLGSACVTQPVMQVRALSCPLAIADSVHYCLYRTSRVD